MSLTSPKRRMQSESDLQQAVENQKLGKTSLVCFFILLFPSTGNEAYNKQRYEDAVGFYSNAIKLVYDYSNCLSMFYLFIC